MSVPPQASSPPPSAQDLYDEYHRRTQRGETVDFDALCVRHPEHEAELRRLHAREQQRARMRAFGGLDRFEEPDPRATAILSELRSRGATIDRYRRLELLGEGGMGRVFEAEDELLGRRVALKVISDRTRAVELLPLFDREMRIAAKLNHPGVGQVLDAGVDGTGRAFFAMTLVRGTDLSKCLELARREKDGWSITRVVGVLRQVADTMSYVHSCRILHRDLKPANIRVGDFGEVFVMDWGVAKALGEAEPSVGSSGASGAGSGTMSGTTVKGTPQYTSPELLRVEVETLEAAADVYSLGAILYEVLAGYAPYTTPGEKTSSERVLIRMSAGPVDPLSEVAKAQPRELVDICEKAMAARGSSRYREMVELSADLRAYLEGRPLPSIDKGNWVALSKWARREKALATAIASGVLVALGGITGVAFKNAELEESLATEKWLKNEALARDRESRLRGLISKVTYFQTLDDDAYAYARKQKQPASEWWLKGAHALVDGLAEDSSKGQAWEPGLRDVEQELGRLRARARERTPEEVATDRAAHPRAGERAALEVKRQWYARMLEREPWPKQSDVATELGQSGWPSAEACNAMAWTLVGLDVDKTYGSEVRALVLARKAVETATDAERPLYRDTLAWALFSAGYLDEALIAGRQAVEEIGALGVPANERMGDLRASLKRLESEVARWRSVARAERVREYDHLREQIEDLDCLLAERRTWRFDTSEDDWWHGVLVSLTKELQRVRDRIEFAERSIAEASARNAWSSAIEAITRSDKYRGTNWPYGDRLTPQLGLVPIGPDPESGLWEFAQLGTGSPARRRSDGKLELDEEMGLVMVLLPGGCVPTADSPLGWENTLGVNRAPEQVKIQAHQRGDITSITLDPFFVSKFEMTTAQWDQARDTKDVSRSAGDRLFPVNNVSWFECMSTLCSSGFGLTLPSEAQWEYACRGGTTTLWYVGNATSLLTGHANTIGTCPGASLLHIGQLQANPFGLHDMHGNIAEWCTEEWDILIQPSSPATKRRSSVPARNLRPGDGRGILNKTPSSIVFRGGSYLRGPSEASSSWRYGYGASYFDAGIGLRPVRPVVP